MKNVGRFDVNPGRILMWIQEEFLWKSKKDPNQNTEKISVRILEEFRLESSKNCGANPGNETWKDFVESS